LRFANFGHGSVILEERIAMKTLLVCGLAAALGGALSLRADVTYTDKVHYNGGTVVDMVKKMAGGPMGARMGQSFQDRTYTVYIKGNKMARVSEATTTIMDYDAGSITNVDHARKTYSVITFDQIKQMQERMQQMTHQSSGEFDVNVSKTGKTKLIGGQTASETIITATSKGGGAARFKSDVWTVSSVPGADELHAFHLKAATANADAFGGAGMMGGAGQAMAAASREALRLGAVPVETETQISGVGAGPMGAGPMGGAPDPDAVAIDMTSTQSGWSTNAVDDSHFAVPAGYTKQERGMGGPGARHDRAPQQ
jgi:hypothetical protein